MIPGMEREPCAAHRPDAPLVAIDRLGVAPQVGVVMNHKAARAIVVLRHLRARAARRRAHHVDQVDQRQQSFTQPGRFGEPVVHLGIDVDGPLRSPGIVDAAGPDALQIRGQAVGARGADEQIARELKIEFLQAEVVGPRADALDSLIGRQTSFAAGALPRCSAMPRKTG